MSAVGVKYLTLILDKIILQKYVLTEKLQREDSEPSLPCFLSTSTSQVRKVIVPVVPVNIFTAVHAHGWITIGQ